MVLWKQHADSNLIVRSSKNPILDIHLYEMEFLGGITELTENIIAELMYAQCDIDGNEYLLLKGFINHRKNCSALNVEDQRTVVKKWDTLRKSTVGWDICYKWKDGSTS